MHIKIRIRPNDANSSVIDSSLTIDNIHKTRRLLDCIPKLRVDIEFGRHRLVYLACLIHVYSPPECHLPKNEEPSSSSIFRKVALEAKDIKESRPARAQLCHSFVVIAGRSRWQHLGERRPPTPLGPRF